MSIIPHQRLHVTAAVAQSKVRSRLWTVSSLLIVATLLLASATISRAGTAEGIALDHRGHSAGVLVANPVAQTIDFAFTSTYDGSAQQAIMQVPTGYQAGQPTPLLIALHDWEEDRFPSFDNFKTATDNAGWLLASPNLHGNRTTGPFYALASLASQHDILDTIQWISERYSVDPNRIYVTGKGMGGQIVTNFGHLPLQTYWVPLVVRN